MGDRNSVMRTPYSGSLVVSDLLGSDRVESFKAPLSFPFISLSSH